MPSTFAAFGLASQLVLVVFFASRRWAPAHANLLGIGAYGFAALGFPLAVFLFTDGQALTRFVGPALFAIWAAFGAAVDVWRPRPWREPPVAWGVAVPYVALYFFAQMWLWWPLWDIDRGLWTAFLVLFVANTALNIRGHLGAESGRS